MPKVDVKEVFKHKVTYNHNKAESRVRPMMMMTDTPNDAIKQQMRSEAINFIKLRSAVASKFKKKA
jgi:hypothetical protein